MSERSLSRQILRLSDDSADIWYVFHLFTSSPIVDKHYIFSAAE